MNDIDNPETKIIKSKGIILGRIHLDEQYKRHIQGILSIER